MKREKYLKKLPPPPKWEPFSPPVDYFSGAVVIPLCNEINFLPATLNSLPPDETVMILLVINHSRNASERVKEANCQTLSLLRSQEIIPEVWRKRCFFFDCGAIDGGVGAARKIGMDAAIASSLLRICAFCSPSSRWS